MEACARFKIVFVRVPLRIRKLVTKESKKDLFFVSVRIFVVNM